jgi:hypothetical protein
VARNARRTTYDCAASATNDRHPTGHNELGEIARVADAILAQITTNAVEDVPVHVNDALLVAAFGRAYRCFRSIRELAGRGEANDAVVLVRALLSIVPPGALACRA